MIVRDAIVQTDLEAFAEALAPDVVWVGLHPGELCRNRGEVVQMLRAAQARGVRPAPVIVNDSDDVLVIDPHMDGRHQVMVLHHGLVSEVRAYPSREAAVAAVQERPW